MTAKAAWPTEADMMGALVADARRLGFSCYPETMGHDLILRAPAGREANGLETGDLIVVEGKLRANLTVLRQAMPPFRRRWWSGTRGAAFYAVAVPSCDGDFTVIAAGLGIVVILVPPPDVTAARARSFGRSERLPPTLFESLPWDEGFRTGLPPWEADLLPVEMASGAPSPRAVTPWKVDAVKLCVAAAARGGVLQSDDFKAHRFVRHRTFVDRGWMRLVRREGRVSTWELVDAADRPDRAYPEIVAALAAQVSA